MEQTLHSHDPEHSAHLSTEQARQGETSGHVRLILGTSLILTLVALGIAYAIVV